MSLAHGLQGKQNTAMQSNRDQAAAERCMQSKRDRAAVGACLAIRMRPSNSQRTESERGPF
eukprot:258289-Chlamydomonas_euryale.AAC.1